MIFHNRQEVATLLNNYVTEMMEQCDDSAYENMTDGELALDIIKFAESTHPVVIPGVTVVDEGVTTVVDEGVTTEVSND